MRWQLARFVLVAGLMCAACSPSRGIEATRVLADLSSPDATSEPGVAPTAVAFPPGAGVAGGDLYWRGRAAGALPGRDRRLLRSGGGRDLLHHRLLPARAGGALAAGRTERLRQVGVH